MRYAACCAPLHRGEREAETACTLMRSRYAAFALGLGPYLVRTLAPDHPDLELPREAFVRELSRAHERQRFLGLRILFEQERDDEGQIMFFARIFEKGVDCSFVELSDFRRDAEGWRYASGIMSRRATCPPTWVRSCPRTFKHLDYGHAADC